MLQLVMVLLSWMSSSDKNSYNTIVLVVAAALQD